MATWDGKMDSGNWENVADDEVEVGNARKDAVVDVVAVVDFVVADGVLLRCLGLFATGAILVSLRPVVVGDVAVVGGVAVVAVVAVVVPRHRLRFPIRRRRRRSRPC